jgi:hypothetical protein
MNFLEENIPQLSDVFRNTPFDRKLLEDIYTVLKD